MHELRNLFIGTALALFSMCFIALSEEIIANKLTWIIQGGVKHGSIVGRNKLDGVSGATKTLWNASAGGELTIHGHHLETGFSMGRTDQHIDYFPLSPNRSAASGDRDISLILLDVPLLYNFHFFPENRLNPESGRLIAGVGAFASFVLSQKITAFGTQTPENLSDWALGPFFRLSYYPIDLKGVRPGLYFDYYRSMLPKYFYDQPYFKQNGIAGQLGAINFGVALRVG